jgi:hypothetical protein
VYAKDINSYKSDQSSVNYYEQDVLLSALEKQSFFVVANSVIENTKLLSNVLVGVESGGFLLTVERAFNSTFRQSGVDVIAKYTDGQQYYILLKKVMP